MNDFKKDILIALLFIAGIWSFISGQFIFQLFYLPLLPFIAILSSEPSSRAKVTDLTTSWCYTYKQQLLIIPCLLFLPMSARHREFFS